MTMLYDYPTLGAIAAYLVDEVLFPQQGGSAEARVDEKGGAATASEITALD